MSRRPQTHFERNEGIIRTVALMRHLAFLTGAKNAYQFAKWYDAQQITTNRASTVSSGKWAKNFRGQVSLKGEQLDLLERLMPYARRFYERGPANLWVALWSDPVDLWALCQTRYSIDIAMAEYEADLLLAQQYNEPLTLRHLSEGIALFRLYNHINVLTRINADGAGLYRSIAVCLEDINVWQELEEIAGFNPIRAAIFGVIQSLEMSRLENDEAYRVQVGVDEKHMYLYIDDPLDSWLDLNNRWEALGDRLAWIT